jgi:hypothetical protein
MLDRFQTRFGIPGVISVIALVFAMFGGAYAASSSSGGGKATASAKAKKGPRGPKGATGPAGLVGPAGPQGPAGANGKDGANGANGSKGATGATGVTGTSVVASNEATGTANCEGRGGSKFVTSATTTFACNGKEGAGGGGGGGLPTTLGSGETETGTYSLDSNGGPVQIAPMSFPIPLDATDAENITVHFTSQEGDATCTGSVNEPTAPAGTFCRYFAAASSFSSPWTVYKPDGSGEGVGTNGALIRAEELAPFQYQFGSFAITAP